MIAAYESPVPILNDLNPIKYGYQDCFPNHKSGDLRKFSLIHYVVKGKGTIIKYGKEYNVNPGEVFFIPANEKACYIADKDEPWSYIWIGFDGVLSSNFNKLPTVFKYDGQIFNDVKKIAMLDRVHKMAVAGKLSELYDEIAENDAEDYYVDCVKKVIGGGDAMTAISAEKVANILDVTPIFLTRHFKKKTGMTVQDYILDVRVEKAKTMLKGGFSVAQIAEIFGYSDYSVFSRMFKKRTGKSPTEWAKENADGI